MSHRQKKRPQRKHTLTHPQPSRASDQPFCAYLGAQGETCAETVALETVFTIEGSPRMAWLACSQHRDEVRQLAASFVLRSQLTPQRIVLSYRGGIYQVEVSGSSRQTEA